MNTEVVVIKKKRRRRRKLKKTNQRQRLLSKLTDQRQEGKLKASRNSVLQWLLSQEAHRRSSEKLIRRVKKYETLGQLRSGVFYCKAGKPITMERVQKYEAMCHFMVRKFLPALALWEAGFDYQDLVNRCRLEVFLCLLNGFDPDKAMTSTLEDPEERAIAEARKVANFEETLQTSEQSMVFGRLFRYMRRTTYDYHPDQLGGRTCSFEAILSGINQAFTNGLYIEAPEDHDAAKAKALLLETMENGGAEKAKALFDRLPSDQKEAVVELLKQSTVNQWSDLLNGDGEGESDVTEPTPASEVESAAATEEEEGEIEQ